MDVSFNSGFQGHKSLNRMACLLFRCGEHGAWALTPEGSGGGKYPGTIFYDPEFWLIP